MTSHAMARLNGRALPGAATMLHQVAAAAWIGGLPYFVLALSRSPDPNFKKRVSERFSRLALVSVATLIGAGLALSWSYIKSPEALVGTAYGVMTLSKALLLAGLLILGATNRLLVRQIRENRQELIRKLRCFSEAEIGIGFTVILAAASLTSQPPAVDLISNRVSGYEIADRLAPRWPRLSSPTHSEISPSSREALKASPNTKNGIPDAFVRGEIVTPNTHADIAWSEYNHHWAGLMVLGIGLLAIAYRSGFAPWARHWPLLFLGLGAFILLRADPEGWPLGPDGFFEGLTNAEVLQHRLAVILVATFGIFEWRLRVGHVKSHRGALIFPAVCAAGGVVLLTHAHALGNIKEELLAEISHLTLALLAVAAGWTRWLELRLPGGHRGAVSWIWPICFALIGVVLLDYREA
jgi:putative copper resistance protein D